MRITFKENSRRFNRGAATDNNGYDKYGKEVERLVSVLPNAKQLSYRDMEYYNFIHFGINTFTNREWGTGKDDISVFNPCNLDTDEWCRILKSSGSKGVIFTAKHHDGFCMWDTATTDRNVMNTPFKRDIVKELSESVKKYDLKLGIYLSPWDRSADCYGKNAYNDYYKRQLTELLTGYGEIFTVWLDGARGSEVEVEPDFQYDFAGFFELVKKYQPSATTAIMGEDIRWIGNEEGKSRKSEWCVVSVGEGEKKGREGDDSIVDTVPSVAYNASDIGSRDLLKNYENLKWYPGEVDVSIRKGWFYHENEKPRSVDNLRKIYYKGSVGNGGFLLLNVPPKKDGTIDAADEKVLAEFGQSIKKDFSAPLEGVRYVRNIQGESREVEGYSSLKDDEHILDLVFPVERDVKIIRLTEEIEKGQRIETFDVYLRRNGKYVLVSQNTVVGYRKIIRLPHCLNNRADGVRVVVRQSRDNASFSVEAFG